MELIFLAQDKNGNVWHFSASTPSMYDEEGGLVLGGSALCWSAVSRGAKAGIAHEGGTRSSGHPPTPRATDRPPTTGSIQARWGS